MATHSLAVLVENKPGVLARIAGLFARRGFNIDSLTVGETEDPAFSRMTIRVHVDDKPLHQVVNQLDKLINVVAIEELPSRGSFEREVALIKVDSSCESEVRSIASMFGVQASMTGEGSILVEVVSTSDRIDTIQEMLRPCGIKEIARSGAVSLAYGDGSMQHPTINVHSRTA